MNPFNAEFIDCKQGEATDMVWLYGDMTERDQVVQALEETLQKVERAKREWEATVDALPDLVCLIDQRGRVLRANRTVEAWNLARVLDVKDRGLHELLHPGCSSRACPLDAFWRQALEALIQGQPVQWESHDDPLRRHVRISAHPVQGRAGEATDTVVVVVRDITEQKRVEHEREQLIKELDTFAHTVAHDLKNPLGTIVGFARIMEEDNATLPQNGRLEFLQAIQRAGLKMQSIIDELLLLAGVQQREAESKPLDMAPIVDEARLRLSYMSREYQAKIVLPESWPAAMGYAPWVEEVWANYLSNAIKYGGQAPRIEIGGEVQPDGMVRFWVRDNGIGVAPKEQARLFTPFTQLAQAPANGHGLGLSIVRRIVEKLGGQVGVESDNVEGQGSLFYFTLPAPPTSLSTDDADSRR
jgi:signal transduction histidine kinase